MRIKYILFSLLALVPATLLAQNIDPDAVPSDNPKFDKTLPAPPSSNKSKRSKAPAQKVKADKVISQTVYMYGIANALGDSTYFVTDIHTIPDAQILKRQGFLLYRESYGIQLKQYLEGVLGNNSQTVAVIFDTDAKRLAKRFAKLKKKLLKRKNAILLTIGSNDFQFVKLEI